LIPGRGEVLSRRSVVEVWLQRAASCRELIIDFTEAISQNGNVMTRSRATSRAAGIGLLWLLLLAMVGQTACRAAGNTIPLELAGQTLQVELAITDAQKARGLMYRREMPDNNGMLFIYESPAPAAYWMKNTFLPLSIAFIGADRRIINMTDMAPNNSTRTYPSRGPCQYVLEVNQGWFERHGVKEGDVVRFELPKSAP